MSGDLYEASLRRYLKFTFFTLDWEHLLVHSIWYSFHSSNNKSKTNCKQMFFNIVKFLWFGNEGKLFLIFFYLFIFFRNYWAQLLVHRISIGVLGREIVGRQLMLLLNKFQALLLRNLAFSVSNGHSRTGFSEYSKPFFHCPSHT